MQSMSFPFQGALAPRFALIVLGQALGLRMAGSSKGRVKGGGCLFDLEVHSNVVPKDRVEPRAELLQCGWGWGEQSSYSAVGVGVNRAPTVRLGLG